MPAYKKDEKYGFFLNPYYKESIIFVRPLWSRGGNAGFYLKRAEWRNLIEFLDQSVKDQKIIIDGFDIGENKILGETRKKVEEELSDYDGDAHKKLEEILGKDEELDGWLKNDLKRRLKWGFGDFIVLRMNSVEVNLPRNKFFRFRDFILKYSYFLE